MFNLISERITRRYFFFVVLAMTVFLGGCSSDTPDEVSPTAQSVEIVTAVPAVESEDESVVLETPVETVTPAVTPTPQLAALVNNEPVLLSYFEQQLAQYEQAQAALGLSVESDYRERVFLDLIEQRILQQTAVSLNIVVSDDMIQARLDELTEQSGGPENFIAWLDANQTTAEAFSTLIAEEMLTSAILQNVTANVPYEVPHIRASYLQVSDAAQAEAILSEVQETNDFVSAAQTYSLDRATGENGGDLGYFAEGDLLIPEVESAAWQLNVDEVSPVVSATQLDNQTIYCIVTVTEASALRPLSEGKRAILLQQTFENWLAEQLSSAEIVRFVE